MSRSVIDLIGKRFGRLIVILKKDNDKWGKPRWLCLCDCGNEKIIRENDLKCGKTKSCGCLRIKHGHNRKGQTTKIYGIWVAIIQRCTNPSNKQYKDYGGRGITVCDRWKNFENFLEDTGERPPYLTIERKNNNKGYCKSNCEWGTRTQQNRNRRNNRLITFKGKTQCIAAWVEEVNINYKTLWNRLFRHEWSIERALTTPVRKQQ